MELRPLKCDAMFITWGPPRRAWLLPKGTLVAAINRHALPPSPITRQRDELYVNAPDEHGKVWQGWLANNVRFGQPASQPAVWLPASMGKRKKAKISAWDEMRTSIALATPIEGFEKNGEPIHAWSARSWISYFGVKWLDQLAKVIHELGGAVPRGDDPFKRAQLALTLILHKEVSMSAIKQSHKASSDATTRAAANLAKTAKTKKTKRIKSEKPKRSMARTVGNALLELANKAKQKAFGTAVAMASDKEVSKSELLKLRDAVNETAAKLREKNKNTLASEFSNQNRLIRRLIRAA